MMKPSILVRNFQEFYRELLIQRECALRSLDSKPIRVDSADTKTQEDSTQLAHLTDNIQEKFRVLFERFSHEAQNQIGEFAVNRFQEALYIMIGLADEVFLSFSWSGQARWKDNLLEAQLFHTQIAGELFFKRLDDLIQKNDPVRTDIAAVYLMCLALGFRGKFRGKAAHDQIRWYKNQLYTMIYHQPPKLFQRQNTPLFHECYEHTLTEAPPMGLPNLQRWGVAIAGALTLYLFVSSVLWYTLVRDMDGTIAQILTQAQQLGVA